MTMTYAIAMAAGRDYRTSDKYEYVIFENEEVVARDGFFSSSRQAKRAAAALYAEHDRITPELPGLA